MKALALTAAPMFGLALPAQCLQQSMPPFAGAPLFFSLDAATAPAATPSALFKCEGFTNVAPAPWSAPFAPQFNLEIALRNLGTRTCSVSTTSPLPDIDALSIGMDWILSDATGHVLVPPNRWGALTFTVSRTSLGAIGSAIRLEAGQPEGPGLDVFSYVLPGSVLPAHLVGRTHRLHDAPEMGLPRQALSIDALDQFIPLYRSDAVIRGLLPLAPTLYFSVSRATIPLVPSSWWAGTPRSGATIFKTTWDVSAQRWGCVQPWRTFAGIPGTPFQGLGLTECEDVDALALDLAHGHVLISTTADGCVRRNQVLYLSLAADGDPVPVPYSTQTGTPVSNSAGLLSGDEVRAICSLDPIAPLRQATGGPPNATRLTLGTPATTLTFAGVARSLEGTMFMACWPGAGPARVSTYGLGWPGAGPAPGVAAAYLTVPGAALAPVFLAAFPRNAAAPFCGDPATLTLPVPNHLRMLVPAFRFAITWVALDSATLRLGQAFPVGLDL